MSARALFDGFVAPPPESRPMMRWWWLGPDVARADITRQLAAMADAGIGGVEVAYVYPLGPVRHPFLSQEFLADLRFAAETATALGLRFDLTLGSGWSFGGPHITADTASRGLRWEVREIGGDPVRLDLAARWPGDELLGVYLGDGSLQEPPDRFERLPADGGATRVPGGRSPRLVAIAWSAPTGQQVKRAAAGAEGPVLDHYSAAATRAHLRAVGEPLLDAVGAERVGSVFCDSLEAYGADWTPGLPLEFAARRASDLLSQLWMLRFDAPGAAVFRSAYFETLAELFEENFLGTIREWAAQRGVPFRVQSYGSPPMRLSSYRNADLVEGEGWGWRAVTQTRWAASAAHRLGRGIVSAEAWTWVHSPSLRATPLDLLGEAQEHFLLGVNQLVGHGWPASPADAPPPGRLFYASGALDDRNAWWPAMPALAAELSRSSWMLRQGAPVADVTLYLPAHDAHQVLGPAQGGGLDLWRACRARIGEVIPAQIREAGFDFDLVDDELLAGLDPAAVAATGPVVLPHVERMPEGTRRWLARFRAAGGTVLDVGGALPDELLGAALRGAAVPALRLEPAAAASQLGFVHRRVGAVDVYFLANTGAHEIEAMVSPRATGGDWQLWDARPGRIAASGPADAPAPVALAPYQALFLVVGDGLPGPGRLPAAVPTDSHQLAAGWTAEFPGSAPEGVVLPHEWSPTRPHFAGTAVYATAFDADRIWGGRKPERVELDLGAAVALDAASDRERGIRGASYRAAVAAPVREVARVYVNDVDCGTLWAPPYRVDVGAALRSGRNELRLEVSNSSAAALTDPAVRAALEAEVSRARERFGVRFRMQDIDRAGLGLSSGLLAVPTLRWAPTA